MLGWIRDKLLRRPSESRQSNRSSVNSRSIAISSNNNTVLEHSTMEAEDANKIDLHVIYRGEIWVVNFDAKKPISDLHQMAICHFLDPNDFEELKSKFKFISVSRKKVLSLQCTVEDERLKENDGILLVEKMATGAANPIKVTIQDVKGPTLQQIMIATVNIPKKNETQIVPSLDCQENFQTEIRKVLYSLVEASAKILAQSPDAKKIFKGIASRISSKNKKEIDKNAVKYLKDLGFTEAQARYALRLKRNRQVEAMEWLLENSQRVKEDWEKDGGSSATRSSMFDVNSEDPIHTIHQLLQDIRDFHHRHFEPSPRALETLTAMGFGQEDIVEALRITNNCPVTACEWLCGERDERITNPAPGLDSDGPLFKALMKNPTIQLGLYNPKIMLAFLSILENPSSANLWLNDVDAAPVLGQVFKIYHSEKHMIVVNHQVELMKRRNTTVS